MNPKHLIFVFMGSVALVQGSTHYNTHVKVNIVAAPELGEGQDKAVDSNNQSESVPKSSSVQSVDPSNVERVVLTPGKHFLISVDPCGETSSNAQSNGNFAGIPLNILTNPPPKDEKDKNPIIPQKIVAAAPAVQLSPDEERILDLIKQQPALNNITAVDLSNRVTRYINFLTLLRKATLNQIIKLPRLVFIGENDEIKYKVIQNIIGVPGCLQPASNAMALTPRFSAPVRFVLFNDPKATETKFRIGDGAETVLTADGSLFKALKDTESIKKADQSLLLSEVPVEITISGPKVPSLVFMDLPWKAPESSEKSANDAILSRLLYKYLEQPWGVTVAIGNANLAYDQWRTLSLMKTFDQNMSRILPVAVNPPEGEDSRIHGIILGLQDALPVLSGGRMFYLDTEKADETALKARSFCSIVNCGHDELIKGLQSRLLRTWYAMRPDATRIIQDALEQLKTRIAGYDGYWGKGGNLDIDKKFKALMDQAKSVLHENIIFAVEDRDSSSCTGSSLDLIKESIFDNPLKTESKRANWARIFAAYQNDITLLPRIPESVDWDTVKSLITELKHYGPSKAIISDLKRLVLKPQLEALRVPKNRLNEAVKLQWNESISNGLESKVSLEAFEEFKKKIAQESGNLLKSRFEIISNMNKQLDDADETAAWTFNFLADESTIWMELMECKSVEEAIDLFKKQVEAGYIELCSRQAVIQPRLIIENLLTKKIVKQLTETVEKSDKKEEIVKMSQKSIDALTVLEERQKIYDELIKL